MTARHPLAAPVSQGAAVAHGRWGIAFGRRFYIAVLLGLVWLGPGWWRAEFLYAIVLWDLLAVAAWVWDLRRLPPPEQLDVSRIWTAAAALITPSEVRLRLRNNGNIFISATAVDDVPASLRSAFPSLQFELPAHRETEAFYSIRPTHRGDAQLGKVYLHYQSSFGFAERWASAGVEQTVRVYPQLEEAKRQVIYLVRSRQIEMEKRRARETGRGREFERLREYHHGDEFRNICWTATARRGKLVTKIYQPERSQTVWVVLDAGRLLCARVAELTKLDCAVDAALGLAHVALYSGDRVGLLAYGRRAQHLVAAGRGSPHLRSLVERLSLVKEELLEADHVAAAGTLLAKQRQRALVVWITDLAETAGMPDVVESVLRMTPRHLVLFLLIGHPELEQAAAARPDTDAQMYRMIAAQELVHRREVLVRGLQQRGIIAVESAPTQLSGAIVNHYLAIKERGRL